MKQKIDTFFVVDFDRCLGNIEGSFDILKEVVQDLGIIDGQIFKSIREEVESNGLTFAALEYIVRNYKSVNLNDIELMYSERAKLEPERLLEPGALEFVNFLKQMKRDFCIMSFGDKRWQTIKIKSSGVGDVHAVIVRKAEKSEYIRDWWDKENQGFIIPGECFRDNVSRWSKGVVLVDDKVSAFLNLPMEARGYYVTRSASKFTQKNIEKLPRSVREVSRIDDIITYESKRSTE
jgi:hypothetical protein